MQRAGQWLRSVQREDGSWRDFWTPSGVSDEWVSGYAGASLALSSRDEERAGAKEAWQYLKSHARTPAGWGYSASVPRDADSTAWALLLAERIGEGGPLPSDEATAFLRRSQVPGGVSTYATAGDIREYVEATGCTDFCGWSAAHDCVTGTAAQVSVLRAALAPAILAAQQDNGSWQSYWWFEDAYATAMSVAALSDVPSPEARRAIARAGVWAELKVQSRADSSPFAAGLLLIILVRASGCKSVQYRLCEELLANQDPGGYWRGSALLRIPPPSAQDPRSVKSWARWWGRGSPFGIYSIDQESVFTTATVYSALAGIMSREQA